MVRQAKYNDEELYGAWVAAGRNAELASRKLEISGNTLLHHVHTKNFQGRYLAEFGGTADAVRKATLLEATMEMGKMLGVLKDIAYNTEEQTKDRIVAARSYLAFIPSGDFLPRESTMTYIEARGSYVTETTSPDDVQSVQSDEDEIKAIIESNIMDVRR